MKKAINFENLNRKIKRKGDLTLFYRKNQWNYRIFRRTLIIQYVFSKGFAVKKRL